MYSTCGGTHQSPVNIATGNVVDKEYPDLLLNKFSNNILDSLIQNNGHTGNYRQFNLYKESFFLRKMYILLAMVTIFAVTTPSISGGPLNAEYQLYQYHFHWGDNATVGSENKLDGHSYPMELHMVFWNMKYDSYTTATTHPDGLTVMAFFFEISSTDNPAFNFVNSLSNIINPETNVEYTTPPNLQQLLPSDMSEYYTLAGSLTTPPCSEIVQWIIFRQSIKVSSNQVKTNIIHNLLFLPNKSFIFFNR
jgi:carbonic anhydrase